MQVQSIMSFPLTEGLKMLNTILLSVARMTELSIKIRKVRTKDTTLKQNLDIKINEYLSLAIDIGGSQENRLLPKSSQSDVYYSLIKGRPTDTAIWA